MTALGTVLTAAGIFILCVSITIYAAIKMAEAAKEEEFS